MPSKVVNVQEGNCRDTKFYNGAYVVVAEVDLDDGLSVGLDAGATEISEPLSIGE